MAGEVIIEQTKLAENITSKVKPVHLKVPSLLFRLEVPAEKNIRKAYDEDPLLRAKLGEAAVKVYDSIERQMEIATRGWDAKVEKVKQDEAAKKALAREYQKLFESQVDLAVKAAQRNTEMVWTELVRTKKDYAKYKWKAGIKVSLGAASVITTVAIMASSGASFGATAIPGILGVIRSTSQLAQQCKALYDELEATIKQLNQNLAKVQATYKDASKGKVGAGEAGAMLVSKVFTIELPSIKRCQELLGRGRSKCDGVVVKSHDIAKKLETALKGVDAIARKADGKSRKKLEAIEDKIDMLIIGVGSEVKRAEDGQRALDASEKIVKGLAAKQPAFLPYVEKAMILIDLGAGATSWSDIAQNATAVTLDLAVDKIFEKV
jgi:hypothetical protein